MNTNTGQIYGSIYTSEAQEAIERGDPVVPVSRRVAKLMRAAIRAEAAATRTRKRRRRDTLSAASRKRNRR